MSIAGPVGRCCWLVGALALGAAQAGEGAPPPKGPPPAAETSEIAKKVQQLADELVTPPAAEPGAEARKEIDALIAQLASDDFKQREAASKAVLKHRAAALGQLRKALENKDPEVVNRARQAVSDIESLTRADLFEKAKALGEEGKEEIVRRLAGATGELTALAAEAKPEKEAEEAERRKKAEAVWTRLGALAELQAAAWGLAGDSSDGNPPTIRLMNVLRDQDVKKRAAAALAMGVVGRGEGLGGVALLGRALNDADAGVRLAVVWAIGLSGQASNQTGQAFLQVLKQNGDAAILKAISAVENLPRQ